MTVKKNLRLRCPRCGTPTPWEENQYRPFCSEKCKLVDLGRWAGEEYRVPGERVDPEDLANVIEFPRKDD